MNTRESGGTLVDRLMAVAALPVFIVLVLISPLMKPRGRVFAPRYILVDGRTHKTFLVDDGARSQRSCELGKLPRRAPDAVQIN